MRRDDELDQVEFFSQRGSWHRLSLPDVNLSRNVTQARHAVASASAGEKASAASWTFMTFYRRLNRAARIMGLGVPAGLPV
jgi:hypothetical protein